MMPVMGDHTWREGELNPSNFGHQPWQGRSRALRTSDTVRGSLGDTSYQDRMYMVKHDLTALDRNTTRLLEMTANNKNMPEWAKSKLTEARSHVSAVANYRQSKLGLTKETGKNIVYAMLAYAAFRGFGRLGSRYRLESYYDFTPFGVSGWEAKGGRRNGK
jgi:hypothetical protein